MERTLLNLGCGTDRWPGWIGVDAYGSPDVKHDLNVIPWPFDDASVDQILASHVFEHLHNWWGALLECVRILRAGGILEIRVPDESSSNAGTFRDHLYVFNLASFQGIKGTTTGTNLWARTQETLPLQLISYARIPFKKYFWMRTFAPWLLRFCGDHLRNFFHEQRFTFQKIGETL